MSTSDNGTCQCCPWCPYRATSTGNRNMGLETEAGATDMKSFTRMADLETTSNGHGNNNTNNTTCAAAKVVDAGKVNNNSNNNKEHISLARISLADVARETRKTRANSGCATAAWQVGNGNGFFFSNKA